MPVLSQVTYPADILVVGHNALSVQHIADVLSRSACSVRQAQSANMVMMAMETAQPELVVMDVNASNVEQAYEICQWLKLRPETKAIPVIFVTMLHDIEHTSRCFEYGAVDVIVQPYNPAEFMLRVKSHVAHYRHEQSLEHGLQQVKSKLNASIKSSILESDASSSVELANKVVELNFEAVMITDAQGRIVRVNPAFSRLTGYTEEEVLGRNPSILKSDKQSPAFYQEMWQSMTEQGHWSGEILNRCKDGNVVSMKVSITAIRGGQGKVSHYVALYLDISESKDTQILIDFLAYHDALTGLPNRMIARSYFDKQLQHVAWNPNTVLGVLCLDLDRFKVINDSLGHVVGDQTLKVLADRLQKYASDNCLVSRNGGDEFLIMALANGGEEEIVNLAAEIVRSVAHELQIYSHRLSVTTSIGVYVCTVADNDLSESIRNAEIALYQAKQEGGNTSQLFTAELNALTQRKMTMETQLRHALSSNELHLVYQPKVSMQTGKIVGAEALIRWKNPVLGFVSPGEFIPLAEETGLIYAIGQWIIDTACKEMRQLKDMGAGNIKISVNLSAHQFRQKNLLQSLLKTCESNGVSPDQLILELTESVLMENPEMAIHTMMAFKETGIQISLDDFGTGYSSLSYLKKFPIDILKIDKSFIDTVHLSKSDASIVHTIIMLARNLGMKVTAEGVELKEQWDFLLEHDCDEVQGYYFSRPISKEDFETLLLK
ncbi:two-component system response regulator [Leeia oryzae]|uniref:two-component system response regulator n=1 Tax=Leeia oryzae TaxID=356662 RepID=UPI0003645AC5|nr:EAL domain-containing protein [Leeia oryzae]